MWPLNKFLLNIFNHADMETVKHTRNAELFLCCRFQANLTHSFKIRQYFHRFFRTFLFSFRQISRIDSKSFSILLLMWTYSSVTTADVVVPVRTLLLSQLAIYPESAAPAVVISLNNSPIASQVEAQIQDIPVRVGDNVKPGAVLVKLACQNYELDRVRLLAERQSTQAKMDLSQWQLKQAETLAQQQTLPEEQVHEKKSQLLILQGELSAHNARIKTVEMQISNCLVRSPFAGVVTERLSSVGQFISKGSQLLRLLDINQPEVSAQVSSKEIAALKNAETLLFVYNGERYPIQLRAVLPIIRTETGSQEVRLDFIERKVDPGAAGRLLWRDNILHISPELLVKRDEFLGVFVARNGLAHFHALPDAQSGRPAAISLPADTRIIISGQFGLQEGAAIKIESNTLTQTGNNASEPVKDKP